MSRPLVQMFLMSSQEGCFASHGFIFLFFRNKSDSQCLNLCYGHFTFVGYILKKMKIVSGVNSLFDRSCSWSPTYFYIFANLSFVPGIGRLYELIWAFCLNPHPNCSCAISYFIKIFTINKLYSNLIWFQNFILFMQKVCVVFLYYGGELQKLHLDLGHICAKLPQKYLHCSKNIFHPPASLIMTCPLDLSL